MLNELANMNILYISHLSTNIAAGLNWSVPASVKAQSIIDNVLWINMTDKLMSHWTDVSSYHNIKEFGGKLKLESLPIPFDRPDIVVFEGFYYFDDIKFANELKKKIIPYIIVPRSSLTYLALQNHARLKKWLAHKLFFDKFVRNAAAIQYLTKKEACDSVKGFKTPYFIIPNGFDTPHNKKKSFHDKCIKAVFIGRLDIFQKGLDLLLDSVASAKNDLQQANFFLDIYGPRRYDYDKLKPMILKRGIESLVELHDEVGGETKTDVILESDLFIMLSQFEGHPMGLIEALAYGVPCLVTPGSNMYDEIQTADAGWVCEGNVESVVKIFRQIINEKELFDKKSANAVTLSKQYEWPVLAKMFHSEVLQLIKK